MELSSFINLSDAERQQLLDIARESIAHGIRSGRPLAVSAPDYASAALTQPLGNFVTLMLERNLRGCVGAIASNAPLAEGIADSAFNAAFNDPRFPELSHGELGDTEIEISILSPPEAIDFRDEAGLIECLQPDTDGIILQEGPRQATFLPKVWEKLGEPGDFLRALKAKAGLPDDHWSDTIRFLRYRTITVAENDGVTRTPD